MPIDFSDEQRRNAEFSMVFKPSGSEIPDKALQLSNALWAMEVVAGLTVTYEGQQPLNE
jgi:hypothetical protein